MSGMAALRLGVLRLKSAAIICVASCLALLACQALRAAPFRNLAVRFTQPDGTQIELRGWGDEFYATFETISGYTVVFDATQKAYYYARLSVDGSQLISRTKR